MNFSRCEYVLVFFGCFSHLVRTCAFNQFHLDLMVCLFLFCSEKKTSRIQHCNKSMFTVRINYHSVLSLFKKDVDA